MYRRARSRASVIAQLAPLVLDAAGRGDDVARSIVERAACKLATLADAVMHRLGLGRERVAFAGGLLSQPNALSEALRRRLALASFPHPLYPPAIGAVLMARASLETVLSAPPGEGG
jgi:N-acetylglucosamine kinase-like BadF-type ATPase